MSNESYVLSLILFYRSYGREIVRLYGQTDVPKKIPNYLITKNVLLKKLVLGSVDPVAARPPRSAHGPYEQYGAVRSDPVQKKRTYLKTKVIRIDEQ